MSTLRVSRFVTPLGAFGSVTAIVVMAIASIESVSSFFIILNFPQRYKNESKTQNKFIYFCFAECKTHYSCLTKTLKTPVKGISLSYSRSPSSHMFFMSKLLSPCPLQPCTFLTSGYALARKNIKKPPCGVCDLCLTRCPLYLIMFFPLKEWGFSFCRITAL